jgi:plastocyanin
VIFVRVGVLVAAVVVIALAVTQQTAVPASVPTVDPILEPTRVPLPTLVRMITSRTTEETPTPGPTATPSSVPRVAVIDNGYAPAQFTIRAGTTVLWANQGGDGHDVTGRGPDGAWRSGPMAPGERYQRAFWIAGTYDYFCSVHPEMRGQLVVKP